MGRLANRIQGRQEIWRRGLGKVRPETFEVSAKHASLRYIGDEFAIFLGADKASGFKLFHMVGEGRRGDADTVTHLGATRSAILATDPFEDFVAARVGECLCDQLDLPVGEFN